MPGGSKNILQQIPPLTLVAVILVIIVSLIAVGNFYVFGFTKISFAMIGMLFAGVLMLSFYHKTLPVLLIAFFIPINIPVPVGVQGMSLAETVTPILLLIYILQRTVHRSDYNRVRLYNIPWIMYLFFAIGIVSFIQSGDYLPRNIFGQFLSAGSFRAYFTFFLTLAGYFLILSLIKDEHHIRQACKTFFWISLIMTGYFLALIATFRAGTPIITNMNWMITYIGGGRLPVRSIGMAQMGLLLFGTTITGEYPRSMKYRVPIVGIALLAVVISGGRAVFVGCVAAGLAYLYFRRYYLVLSTATVATVLMISIPIVFPSSVQALPESVQRVVQFQSERDTHAGRSVEARLLLWRMSLDEIAKSPLTGVGFRQFDVNLLIYGQISGDEAFAELGVMSGSTHNGYLAFAQVFGIPALILFLALFYQHFRKSWIMYYRHPDPHVHRISLFIMIMLVARSVMLFAGGGPKELGFFVFLGIAQAVWLLVLKNQHAEEKEPEVSEPAGIAGFRTALSREYS